MPLALLIGLASGLASAVVFASAATGPLPVRLLLFLVTPLPIYLAGFVHGWRSSVAGVVAGFLLITVLTHPLAGAMFAVCEGLPGVVLVHLATLYRNSGPLPSPSGVEWYPLGRIVVWAAVIGAALAVLTVLLIGGDREAVIASLKVAIGAVVKKEVTPSGVPVPLDDAALTNIAQSVWSLLPAFSAATWMGGHLLNLWIAAHVTRASGHLARPWPDIAAFHLQPRLPIALALATAASFAGGNLGLVATAYSGGLTFAYVLLGLAIIHYVTRGLGWRPFLLSTLYAACVVLNAGLLLVVALIGLADAIRPLRRRPPSTGGPPPPAPTPIV